MALKQAVIREGFGMEFSVDWFSPNFTIIDIGVHYHPKTAPDRVLHEHDLCSFRVGAYVCFLGVQISIGRFWRVRKEDQE
jgi:hypothetical protein